MDFSRQILESSHDVMIVLEIWNLGLFSVRTGESNDEACYKGHGVATEHVPILDHNICGIFISYQTHLQFISIRILQLFS